jgi:hypothetical protein
MAETEADTCRIYVLPKLRAAGRTDEQIPVSQPPLSEYLPGRLAGEGGIPEGIAGPIPGRTRRPAAVDRGQSVQGGVARKRTTGSCEEDKRKPDTKPCVAEKQETLTDGLYLAIYDLPGAELVESDSLIRIARQLDEIRAIVAILDKVVGMDTAPLAWW